MVSHTQMNSLLYILLVFFETHLWWSRLRPKHVAGYQCVIKHFYQSVFVGLLYIIIYCTGMGHIKVKIVIFVHNHDENMIMMMMIMIIIVL